MTDEKRHRQREYRNAPENWANRIYETTRHQDKKQGRENDLDVEFIEEMISCGCINFGEEDIRMTLDRIDNRIGHTKSNVLPACVRCNIIKGSMPFQAWTALMPHIEDLRKRGLFGDWTGLNLTKEVVKRFKAVS